MPERWEEESLHDADSTTKEFDQTQKPINVCLMFCHTELSFWQVSKDENEQNKQMMKMEKNEQDKIFLKCVRERAVYEAMCKQEKR